MTIEELRQIPNEQKKIYALYSLLEKTKADSEPLQDFSIPVEKQRQKLEELQKKYVSILSVVTDQKEKAADIISKIELDKQRRVLTDRYINCMKWKDILEKYEIIDHSSLLALNRRALKSFQEVQEEQLR